jgi:hypothetical protein
MISKDGCRIGGDGWPFFSFTHDGWIDNVIKEGKECEVGPHPKVGERHFELSGKGDLSSHSDLRQIDVN